MISTTIIVAALLGGSKAMCGANVSKIEGDNIHAVPFLGFKQLSESVLLNGCGPFISFNIDNSSV